MSERARASSATVAAFLAARWGCAVGEPLLLTGGTFSRAYAFDANGCQWVIRVNSAIHAAESFAKDAFAAEHFAARHLPIPRVVDWDEHEDYLYAISVRAAGRVLEDCSDAERRLALPGLLATMDAIAQADTSASSGYGDWGVDGNGKYAGWREFLTSIARNDASGYDKNWHALFATSFMERDLFEAVYRRLQQLAVHCPEQRALIHNDFWFTNVIADGARITGVIDWANALYGDPLYEVARLAWGSAWPEGWFADGADIMRSRYGAAPDYTTRLACYCCHIGLDDMRYYARNGKRAEYDFFRPRLLGLLSDPPAIP
jgi:hygromycin-B 4-O-kinase